MKSCPSPPSMDTDVTPWNVWVRPSADAHQFAAEFRIVRPETFDLEAFVVGFDGFIAKGGPRAHVHVQAPPRNACPSWSSALPAR